MIRQWDSSSSKRRTAAHQSTGLALVFLALLPSPALAQDANATSPEAEQGGVQDIIVTARKRSESIQQVPIAISALSSAQLEQRDVGSVMDLSSVVPNFQAPKNTVSFSAPQFYLRGAGRANNNWNAENAVAVFVDDIYLQSTAAAYIDMIDFERVEVLRGPQGTLYGRNATVGAIKFVPRKPDLEKITAAGAVTFGSHNRIDIKGNVSIPLIEDKLAIKLDAYRTANDGFVTLVNNANQPISNKIAKTEHYGARFSSLFRPSEGLEFELNFDAFKQNDGTNLMTPIVPANPTSLAELLSKNGSSVFRPLYGVNRGSLEPLTAQGGFNRKPGYKFDGFGIVFKGSAETGLGTFKSISGYRKYNGGYVSQLSSQGGRSTIFGITLGSTVDSQEDYKQFTQEFQLTGTIASTFKYTLGAYYFSNQWGQLQYGSTIGVPVEFSPVSHPGYTERFGGSYQDTFLNAKSYALYLDTSWEIFKDVSLLGGIRQTWDRKKIRYNSLFEDQLTPYPGFPVNPKKSFSRLTPRVGINWQATRDVLVYATYTTGYKAGNLEGDRATSPGPASNYLSPETVKTFETGIKAEWFDRLLRTNITAFFSKFRNHADLISPQTVALSDQRINGVELEVTLVPSRHFQMYGNLGLLDAKYTRADASHPIFAPDFTGFAPGLSAKPVSAPKYSFSVGANYRLDIASAGELVFDASIDGVGKHFNGLGVANLDSERVAAYSVANGSVTFRTADGHISVTGGVDNLFDKTYWTTGFFGSVPEYAGRAYADGRSWYVKLGYRF
ncbi:TonB-dependent receptor [Aquisediminimonas profunda]|uniref:TonB-dependent receptor n=1 Tax=Aquisediminimonas profunda TaxID=1550733 RepID=UPI001C636CD9|nr:TonB-dependent receptor [Aquisediminimonas profunda]